MNGNLTCSMAKHMSLYKIRVYFDELTVKEHLNLKLIWMDWFWLVTNIDAILYAILFSHICFHKMYSMQKGVLFWTRQCCRHWTCQSERFQIKIPGITKYIQYILYILWVSFDIVFTGPRLLKTFKFQHRHNDIVCIWSYMIPADPLIPASI